jgi:hypothetical protein
LEGAEAFADVILRPKDLAWSGSLSFYPARKNRPPLRPVYPKAML